jgi:hypothetical protein
VTKKTSSSAAAALAAAAAGNDYKGSGVVTKQMDVAFSQF